MKTLSELYCSAATHLLAVDSRTAHTVTVRAKILGFMRDRYYTGFSRAIVQTLSGFAIVAPSASGLGYVVEVDHPSLSHILLAAGVDEHQDNYREVLVKKAA